MLDRISLLLVILGSINWGLLALFQIDLVASIFGGPAAIMSRVIYALFFLAGLWCINILARMF